MYSYVIESFLLTSSELGLFLVMFVLGGKFMLLLKESCVREESALPSSGGNTAQQLLPEDERAAPSDGVRDSAQHEHVGEEVEVICGGP